MTDYRSLNVGDSIIVEREGVALAAVRWAIKNGMKYSRKRHDKDGRYVVTRLL